MRTSSEDETTFRHCNVSKEGNEISEDPITDWESMRKMSRKRIEIVWQLISENKAIVLSLNSSDEWDPESIIESEVLEANVTSS